MKVQHITVDCAAGASLVAGHRGSQGRGWVVLADPEGTEFCVEKER